MVKITITKENGSVQEYENVVAYDFYDKEFCESVAGREMTDNELNEVYYWMNKTSEVTDETVTKAVKDVIKDTSDTGETTLIDNIYGDEYKVEIISEEDLPRGCDLTATIIDKDSYNEYEIYKDCVTHLLYAVLISEAIPF